MAQEQGKLWGEVSRHLSNDNYDAAVSACTKLRKLAPEDVEVHLVQLFCLIQLHQYDAALKLMDENSQFRGETTLQRGYCEYRVHKLDDALSTLAKGDADDAAVTTLKAQVEYRKENFAKAAELYTTLDWEDNSEVYTNLSASYACAKAAKQATSKPLPEYTGADETYETCFNKGTYALACGDYAEAEKLLTRARDMGRESLREEGFDEAETEEELGQINTQLALVYQLTGRTAQAKEAYEAILKAKPSDAAVTAVATNNLVSLMGDKNVFDSKQRMKATAGHGLDQKLASYQKNVITGNQALLHFYDKQMPQCNAALDALKAADPDSALPVLIQAATFARNQQADSAIDTLERFAAEHPKANNERVYLSIGQLRLVQKDYEGALKALSSASQLRYRPGVVSSLVALHEQIGAAEGQSAQEHADAAAKLLEEAVRHAEQTKQTQDLAQLLAGQAEFLMEHGKYADAAEAYAKLLRQDKSNKRALAGLVIAYSHFDLAKAEQYAAQLPEITGTPSASVETLEATLPGRQQTAAKKAEAAPVATEEVKKKRKKRKGRKGKLPKDTSALIDPERWLPKWQRSYNRRKYKKQAQAMRGPQGAAASTQTTQQTGSLGGLKGKSPQTTSPPPQQQQQAGAGGEQKKTQANKKKKGKK